jgi:hypothetical protein
MIAGEEHKEKSKTVMDIRNAISRGGAMMICQPSWTKMLEAKAHAICREMNH